jgi:hypothetical protein
MGYGGTGKAAGVVGTTGTLTIGGAGGVVLQKIVVTKFLAAGVVTVKANNDSGATLFTIDATVAECQGTYDFCAHFPHAVFIKVTGGAAEIVVVWS